MRPNEGMVTSETVLKQLKISLDVAFFNPPVNWGVKEGDTPLQKAGNFIKAKGVSKQSFRPSRIYSFGVLALLIMKHKTGETGYKPVPAISAPITLQTPSSKTKTYFVS